MTTDENKWRQKGATLSHKTACKEYGLTHDEIVRAIRAGKLQYREGSMHGNPWLRLLRQEVETLVKEKGGSAYLNEQKVKAELAQVNRELRRLKKQIAGLEKEKSKLTARLRE